VNSRGSWRAEPSGSNGRQPRGPPLHDGGKEEGEDDEWGEAGPREPPFAVAWRRGVWRERHTHRRRRRKKWAVRPINRKYLDGNNESPD